MYKNNKILQSKQKFTLWKVMGLNNFSEIYVEKLK
jgi:hypothetical protein